jgi:hypothetical protein
VTAAGVVSASFWSPSGTGARRNGERHARIGEMNGDGSEECSSGLEDDLSRETSLLQGLLRCRRTRERIRRGDAHHQAFSFDEIDEADQVRLIGTSKYGGGLLKEVFDQFQAQVAFGSECSAATLRRLPDDVGHDNPPRENPPTRRLDATADHPDPARSTP